MVSHAAQKAKATSKRVAAQKRAATRAPTRAANGQALTRAKRANASTKPSAAVVTVTPDEALDWLDTNTHNRPLRQARVDRLAEAILRGEWALNGDAIRFGADGTLLDGQHRLWAIATAGVAVETLVVRGLAKPSQDTMDQGVKRNLGDVLALRGHPSPSRLAAAVTYWWRYQNGYIRVMQARPTIQQALETLDQDPGLEESVAAMWHLIRRFRLPAGVAAAVHYEWHSIDDDTATEFLDHLLDGTGLEPGTPLLALRRWLERRASGEQAQGQSAAPGARADAVVVHAMLNKAWNAHRAGHPVERLSWKATGMKAEGFPEAE